MDEREGGEKSGGWIREEVNRRVGSGWKIGEWMILWGSEWRRGEWSEEWMEECGADTGVGSGWESKVDTI